MSAAGLAIELRDVERRYPAETGGFALCSISISIPRGSWTVITGRSGAGKTTLLNLMSTLDRSDRGSVRILGAKWSGRSESELARLRRQSLGIVTQQPMFIEHLTVWQNVTVGWVPQGVASAERKTRARASLEALGIEYVVDRLPSKLSGGEQQRIALARAVVHQPAILFADEPTSNVDLETGHQVTEFLRDLVRRTGTTVVISTHDPDLIAVADHRFRLEAGLVSP